MEALQRMSTQPIATLVVDDHPLYADALMLAVRPLVGGGEISAVGSLAEACRILATGRFGLILLDLQLPDTQSFEGVARLRGLTSAQLVVISARVDPATIALVRETGADGFIAKSNPIAVIQGQLQAVLAGKPVFPTQPVAAGIAKRIADLTPAQARVLAAAATGKLNKQIAADLNLSESTVKSHMSAILSRLALHNRTQAILALSGTVYDAT